MELSQHTSPLEDAISHGSQRVAQFASLIGAAAQVLLYRRALRQTRIARATTALPARSGSRNGSSASKHG